MEDLLKVNDQTEKDAWQVQAKAGMALGCIAIHRDKHSFILVTVLLHHLVVAGIAKVGLDGTLYDQVLDWIFALGLAPSRFSKLSGYDLYFAMARGTEGAVALDMSKFFDTNYHYMVKRLLVAKVPDIAVIHYLACTLNQIACA